MILFPKCSLKNNLLTNKIKKINKDFREEKKATNTLVQQSLIKNQQLLAATKTIIRASENQKFSNALEENKLKQSSDSGKILRKRK